MTIDPKDLVLSSYLVDTNRFSSVVANAMDLSRTGSFSGVSTAIEASNALRTALYLSVNRSRFRVVR